MNSSTKSLDRISYIDTYNENGVVTVTIYWLKPKGLLKESSNRRWLRRQVKRIVDNIEYDAEIKQLDLFMDSTDVVFHNDFHAAQFILEHS